MLFLFFCLLYIVFPRLYVVEEKRWVWRGSGGGGAVRTILCNANITDSPAELQVNPKWRPAVKMAGDTNFLVRCFCPRLQQCILL